jgi:hypothetical protein
MSQSQLMTVSSATLGLPVFQQCRIRSATVATKRSAAETFLSITLPEESHIPAAQPESTKSKADQEYKSAMRQHEESTAVGTESASAGKKSAAAGKGWKIKRDIEW